MISACSRCLNPYREADYRAMMEVAVSDDLEIIVSNTTEAGIAYDPSCKADDMPPASFPAKLAQVLHARWAAGKQGVIVLACELIDHNGEELLRIMNQYVSDWGWEDEFSQWMANDCTVCTTLVDTIVPGRIRDPKEAAAVAERLGYEDPFLAVREPFQMWGIQGDESLKERLPFVKAGLPDVFVTPDVTPYKKRKVRILNGAHTAFVPGSWVAGFDIVRDCMHDETVRGFMNTMLYDEVIPTLAADLDVEDCKAFAAAVENRFDNPFIDHALLSICLNSTAKWRARDLPTLKDYAAETGNLPKCLATSLATLISFYTQELVSREGDGLHLRRSDGTEYTAQDDAFVLDFYAAHAGARRRRAGARCALQRANVGRGSYADRRPGGVCRQRSRRRALRGRQAGVRERSGLNPSVRPPGNWRASLDFCSTCRVRTLCNEHYPDQSGRQRHRCAVAARQGCCRRGSRRGRGRCRGGYPAGSQDGRARHCSR